MTAIKYRQPSDPQTPFPKPEKVRVRPDDGRRGRLEHEKPVRIRRAAYLAWIRRHACAVCGKRPAEAAHVSDKDATKGLGSKVSDLFTVPLCAEHHRGNEGLDRIGFRQFETAYSVNVWRVIAHLLERYSTL